MTTITRKKQGETAMLKHILLTMMMAALLVIASLAPARAMISEPSVVYYGSAPNAGTTSTVTLTLQGANKPIAIWKVGGDRKYVLRVPMDSVGARLPNTARTGDTAAIAVDGVVVKEAVVIPLRGSLVKLELGTRTADQWAKDHPGDNGSGDMNRNGISDLQDYLNGNDPASCVWTAVDASHAETSVYHPLVLNNCLADSGTDQKHNLIRLAKGTYAGNFSYAPAWGEEFGLTLTGGYDPAGSGVRSADPALTILNGDTDSDGTGNGTVLVVNTDTAKTHGKVHIEGLTVKNGKASTGQRGGGIQARIYQGDLELVGNIISGNSADIGGGLSAESSDSGQIFLTNNIIFGNSAANAAAARIAAAAAGAITLLNNTVANNTATAAGDGRSLFIESSAAAVELTNNIIAGLAGLTGSDVFINSLGASIPLSITHNAFAALTGLLANAPGFVPDVSNISSAPQFKALQAGDYRLQATSPGIDTGVSHAKLLATDAGGLGRLFGNSVDLGAYEYHGIATSPATARTLSGATLNGLVNANDLDTTVSFEYGPDTGYGSMAVATPLTVTGMADTPVSAAVNGLTFRVYHYRVVAVNSLGTTYGNDQSFTLNKFVAAVSMGNLSQMYDGTPKTVTISTIPTGLAVDVTYNGSSTVPVSLGSYDVVAAVNDSTYKGAARGTLIIGEKSTGPSITLSTLADGAVTTVPTLNITGMVSAPNGLQGLTVNTAPVTIDSNGIFTMPVTLRHGSNTIAIVATDSANLVTTVNRAITLDAAAPLITLTSGQTDNSVTTLPQITVSGTVDTTAATVRISINGSLAQPATMASNSFTLPVDLAVGLNTVQITATNANGKSSSIKQSVTRTTALTLAVTAPAHDLKSGKAALTLTGTVAGVAPLTVNVAMDGQSYSPDVISGNFSQALTFAAEKTYPILVVATDGNGNSVSVTRNVIHAWLGDTNGSNSTSLIDVLQTYRFSLGLDIPTATDLLRSDVAPLDASGQPQGNGVIDLGDVILQLRNSMGLLPW